MKPEIVQRRNDSREEFDDIIRKSKPRSASFLREKYHHYLEVQIAREKRKLDIELQSERKRILDLRVFASLFTDHMIMERTGYSFGRWNPGQELVEDDTKLFDLCLQRSAAGGTLFIHYVPDSQRSAGGLVKDLQDRFTNLSNGISDMKDQGSFDALGTPHQFALLISGQERKFIGKAIQAIGAELILSSMGEVFVFALDHEARELTGFPYGPASGSGGGAGHRSEIDTGSETGSRSGGGDHGVGNDVYGKWSDAIPFPDSTLQGMQPLPGNTHEFVTFETILVSCGYANNLMQGVSRPKEISYQEIKKAYANLSTRIKKGDRGKGSISSQLRSKRITRLNGVLKGMVEYNLIELAGQTEKQSPEVSWNKETVFRLVCQGSDLSTVQKNLQMKYTRELAERRAKKKARVRAVEAYRKRFPRIDGSF